MESNWRYNVPFYGLAYSETVLLARLLWPPAPWPTYVFRQRTPPYIWVGHANNIAGIPEPVVPYYYAHFPGPFFVEPDHP